MKRSSNSYPIGRREKGERGGEGKKEGKKYIFAASVIGQVSLPSPGNETMEPFRVLPLLRVCVIRETIDIDYRCWFAFSSSWWQYIFFNMFVTNVRFRMECWRWIATLEAILHSNSETLDLWSVPAYKVFRKILFRLWGEGGGGREPNIERRILGLGIETLGIITLWIKISR